MIEFFCGKYYCNYRIVIIIFTEERNNLKMKIRYSIIILIIFFVSYPLLSQGGSNYSVIGVGEIHSGIGAGFDGLGGTSLAIPFDNVINTRNPAQWSFLMTTRIQAGYRFNQQLVSQTNADLYQNNGKVDGMLINFCLDTSNGLNIGMGFSSYSSVNYLISQGYHIDTLGIIQDGLHTYQGLGGLSQGYIGGAVKLFDRLSLGAAIFSLFGNIQTNVTTQLYADYSNIARTSIIDNFSNVGFRSGFIYNPFAGLYFGGYYETNGSLKIIENTNYYATTITDSIYTQNSIVKFPSSFGLGLSYKFEKFLISADFLAQDFTNFDSRFFPPYAKTRPFKQFSFGVSRFGNRSYSSRFFDRITYNFGGGYKQHYYYVNNNPINEYYGSFGVMTPLVGYATLDAAVTLGSRGTTDNGLLRELFGRLSVSISLGDVWFQPFKREY